MIAIALALITKEVYSSLFVGILVGGLLYSNFGFEGTVRHVFLDGIVGSLTDSYNMGILLFLVILGAMVCLINRAGGSAAFGRWAQTHIKSRVGAQLTSVVLGCLIFIDDYFNCLTVGSVMRPVTDKHRISRAKLAYIIDATAAPVCIIAPHLLLGRGSGRLCRRRPGADPVHPGHSLQLLRPAHHLHAGVHRHPEDRTTAPMARCERNAAEKGDLFSGKNPYAELEEEVDESHGRVMDLVLPILVLIVCCIIGMLYSGGFFEGTDFVTAFSNSDASVGLLFGSAFALVFTLVYYAIRRSMTFGTMMSCIPEGFKAMVPAILILTFAWSLKAMTDSLGVTSFVRDFVYSNAASVQMFLPAIVFLIGCGLAFATGTSWGTFGMLIPIVQSVFPHGQPSVGGMHLRLHGRGGVRGPLLPHLRHHHHGLRRGPVRPRAARVHPAALRHHGGGGELCVLPHRRVCPQRGHRPAPSPLP